MSGYYYECPACDKQHVLQDADVKTGRRLPSQTCWGCFDEGCKECMPKGMCAVCAEEDEE